MKNIESLLKQGWLRAMLYVLAVVAVMMFVQPYVLLSAIVAVITYLFRTLADRKSFMSLGFYWKGFSNEAALGLASAIAIIGVGTLILILSTYLTFIGNSFTNEILITIGFLVLVAFIEELIFRGYLLNNLMQSTNKWIALFLTAILFTLAHTQNPNVTILPIINVFAAGILLGINYIYTKNLWFSIFFHFAWNVFQGPVLGYKVSGLEMESLLQQALNGSFHITGGPFGFEGSLVCLILLVLFIGWFAYAFNKRYQSL